MDRLSHCCGVERAGGNEGYALLETLERRAEPIRPELANLFV